MCNVLVLGATGNVGSAVMRFLATMEHVRTIAAVRNEEEARGALGADVECVRFDFEDFSTFRPALNGIESVFLLRPPHISDVFTFFRPLIAEMEYSGVKNIVFLSVQGVETSKAIPHNKIERLIRESSMNYIFLRPSYFMQNLTTTLNKDITEKRQIILPAGNAKFNWVDVENVGEAAAHLLSRFETFKNQAFDITGLETEDFASVTARINEEISQPIAYRNVNPFTFYAIKRREGMVKGMIIVMILLHFLPRFQKLPKVSDFYQKLTGKTPTDLQSFIRREREQFEGRSQEMA